MEHSLFWMQADGKEELWTLLPIQFSYEILTGQTKEGKENTLMP